ncbi:hypothetical protein QTP88_022150 [Uroleucon formosanum]
MGLVNLESAYRGANVVIAKPIAEKGGEDVVEQVVNLEPWNGEDKTSSDVQKDIKPNLKGDRLNVAFLVLLYMLQGIPLGISLAIRAYMQNKKVSYGQQAKFSVVDLPYSLKLLWAPLVDVVYLRRIGKRKSWLVPLQFCIGLSLIFIGSNINNWMMGSDTHMTTLTYVFFCVNALAATNDIAIDGWTLTLLRRENVGYASTCNTSGQALGIALGYVMFILFESEEFCNKWLRFTVQKGGIVSMEGNAFLRDTNGKTNLFYTQDIVPYCFKFPEFWLFSNKVGCKNVNSFYPKSNMFGNLKLKCISLNNITMSCNLTLMHLLTTIDFFLITVIEFIRMNYNFVLTLREKPLWVILLGNVNISSTKIKITCEATKPKLIAFPGYLYFWGIIFTVSSTSIAFFVKDTFNQVDKIREINIKQIYKVLWKIINLRTMRIFILIMLAYEMSFSSMGSFVSNPKFMEYGVAKEDMALVDLSLIPMKIFIPILISKFTSGLRPLKILYKTVPYRLVLGISSGVLVYYTPYFVGGEYHNWSFYFFLIYELYRILRLVLFIVVYLSVRSFFIRISDPRIGGTYMSLLNTVWYLGIAISRISALGMLNFLTVKQCSTDRATECRFKTVSDEYSHRRNYKRLKIIIIRVFVADIILAAQPLFHKRNCLICAYKSLSYRALYGTWVTRVICQFSCRRMAKCIYLLLIYLFKLIKYLTSHFRTIKTMLITFYSENEAIHEIGLLNINALIVLNYINVLILVCSTQTRLKTGFRGKEKEYVLRVITCTVRSFLSIREVKLKLWRRSHTHVALRRKRESQDIFNSKYSTSPPKNVIDIKPKHRDRSRHSTRKVRANILRVRAKTSFFRKSLIGHKCDAADGHYRLREVCWRRMCHRSGRLLCRSGILHGVWRDVVLSLEKNPRELTVQGTERLASEPRWADPRHVTGMTITCWPLATCQICVSVCGFKNISSSSSSSSSSVMEVALMLLILLLFCVVFVLDCFDSELQMRNFSGNFE